MEKKFCGREKALEYCRDFFRIAVHTPLNTYPVLVLAILFLCCGCSEKKARKMPKTHPELLLEITEEAKKKNHKGMLPKIARLRAIDPTCTFIAELESVTRMNVLVEEINRLAAAGKFQEALLKVEHFERLNGPDTRSGKVKEHLSTLLLIEKQIKVLQNPRNSTQFRRDLAILDSLNKKIRFSPGLRNFAAKKRSELARFRIAEYGGICFSLWSDALDMKESEDPAFPALLAILESTRKDFPGFYLLTVQKPVMED